MPIHVKNWNLSLYTLCVLVHWPISIFFGGIGPWNGSKNKKGRKQIGRRCSKYSESLV
jgi:hypothetical protein